MSWFDQSLEKGNEPQFPHLGLGSRQPGPSPCTCDAGITLQGPDLELLPWEGGRSPEPTTPPHSVLPVSLFQPEGAPRAYTYSAFFCPNGESLHPPCGGLWPLAPHCRSSPAAKWMPALPGL